MKKLVVIFVLIFVLCLSVIGTASADNVKVWKAAFTYDAPSGTFHPGLHFYQFEFDWNYPDAGIYTSEEATFFVDANAPLYPGYVVLRGKYGGAYAKPLGEHGSECIQLDPVTIHPDQPVRFHVGWVPGISVPEPMTSTDAKAHFQSMITTVDWGDGPVEMIGHEVTPSGNGNYWPNNICSYTVRN